MTKEELEKYRVILERETEKLKGEIAEHEKAVDLGNDIEGGDEEADEAEEMGNQLAISQTLRNRLDEIEGALERIKAGSYGKCLKCGEEISKEVLEIVPESELGAECKKGV